MIHNYRIGAIDDNGELLGFVSELKGMSDEYTVDESTVSYGGENGKGIFS